MKRPLRLKLFACVVFALPCFGTSAYAEPFATPLPGGGISTGMRGRTSFGIGADGVSLNAPTLSRGASFSYANGQFSMGFSVLQGLFTPPGVANAPQMPEGPLPPSIPADPGFTDETMFFKGIGGKPEAQAPRRLPYRGQDGVTASGSLENPGRPRAVAP